MGWRPARLAAVTVLGSAALFAGPAPSGARTSVLFMGWRDKSAEPYYAELSRAGFDVGLVKFPVPRQGIAGTAAKKAFATTLAGLTKTIRQYHVVVVVSPGCTRTDYTPFPEQAQVFDALQQYVKDGGGLFIHMNVGQLWTATISSCLLAKRFGGDYTLCALADPTTDAVATAWRIRFAYTEHVPRTPVSKGVKGVWYPLSSGGAGPYSAVGGMILSKPWTPFLLAGPGARAVAKPTGVPAMDQRAAHAPDPPYAMLAGRPFGKGRVAMSNIPPSFTITCAATPALERTVLSAGLQGKPSDMGKLFGNIYRWLGEPARAAGLGGAKDQFAVAPAKKRTAPPPLPGPVVWDKYRFKTPKKWRGLVGARTVYSVGKATVKQHCDAARRLGLDFLCFTEDFASLKKGGLAKLKAECRAQSSDTFVAVPGFIIEDAYQDHFFLLGDNVVMPEPDLLSPDGKRLDVRKDKHPTWQMADVWIDYIYTRMGFTTISGSCLHRTGLPYYDFRDYQAVALVTRHGDKVLDDLGDGYHELCADGQNLLPFAIELADTPDELARALRTGYRVEIFDNDWVHKCTLNSHWGTWHCTYAAFPHVVTSGPDVVQWERLASHDYWADGHRWHPGYYETRIRAVVASTVGLREIRVYDNRLPYRRFRCNGAKRFTVEFKAPRDRQHGYYLVADDVTGGRAVTGVYNTQNNQFEEFMCGDRNNQLAYGSGWWPDGTFFKLAIGTTPATPNKGPWSRLIFTCGPYKWDPKVGVGVADFDGSPEYDPILSVYPHVYPKKDRPENVLHNRARRLLVCADVMIGQGDIDGAFPKGYRPTNVWHSAAPIQPTRLLTGHCRYTLWSTLPGGPVCYVISGEFGVKKPIDLARTSDIVLIDARGAKAWSLRDNDGNAYSGRRVTGGRGQAVVGRFGPGACYSLYDCGLGACALVSLSPSLDYYLPLPAANRFFVRHTPAGMRMEPGKPLVYRLLLLSYPRTTPPNDLMTNRFLRAFGLTGQAPAYKLDVDQGKVLDQRFELVVDGAGMGFAGTIGRANLPTYLPVKVTGLNENWSTGYYDRTKKRYRGVGILEGTAYATVNTRVGHTSLFIGHPVTADNPALQIYTTQTGNGSFEVELHNPTEGALRVTLTPSPVMGPYFRLPKTPVDVAPGASVVVQKAVVGKK